MHGGGLKCWVHLTSPIGLIELQGVLRLAAVVQVRDAVWKVMAERPDAVVLDLAALDDREELGAGVFAALGRSVADMDGELILAAPSGRMQQALHRAGPLFVRMFGTLSQAMEEAARAPARRRVTCRLSADRCAARSAREVVEDVCGRWRLATLREQALVVVSELVGDAVEHGRAPIELCITAGHHVLRIEVSDHSSTMPGRSVAPEGCVDYGLRLVEAMARNWGARPTQSGRTVWAHLLIPAEPGVPRHLRL